MSRNWLEIEKWTFHYLCIRFKQKQILIRGSHLAVLTEHSPWILGVLQTEHFLHGFDLQKVPKWKIQQELPKGRSSVWMEGENSVYSLLYSAELGFQMISGWFVATLTMEKIKSRVWLGSGYSSSSCCYWAMISWSHVRSSMQCDKRIYQILITNATIVYVKLSSSV